MDKGKVKMPEYEDNQFDSSELAHSLDNMINIYLALNLVFHTHSKHIEVHYHFIREHVQVGDVDLQHINTNLQTIDIFTKVLGALFSLIYLVFLSSPLLTHNTHLFCRTESYPILYI